MFKRPTDTITVKLRHTKAMLETNIPSAQETNDAKDECLICWGPLGRKTDIC